MKNIIWSSFINYPTKEERDSVIEDFSLDYGDEVYNWTDEELNKVIEDYNNVCLEVEMQNLDKEFGNKIIAYGQIRRWDGTRTGMKVLGNNLNNCLKIFYDYSDGTFFVKDNEFQFIGYDHDGGACLSFKLLKDDENDFVEEFTFSNDVEKLIKDKTLSLAPYINEVYGWK